MSGRRSAGRASDGSETPSARSAVKFHFFVEVLLRRVKRDAVSMRLPQQTVNVFVGQRLAVMHPRCQYLLVFSGSVKFGEIIRTE
jgi:hypothetical protein